jgi:GT2 family glycosyltransferase
MGAKVCLSGLTRLFTPRTILQLLWNARLKIIELKTTEADITSTKSIALKNIALPSESIRHRGTVRQYPVVSERLPAFQELPKVSIVILNWNNKNDTLECLDSVSRIDYNNFEVMVVDNGSTDGSVQAIQHLFPQVAVLETGKNLGYAGGNNVGLRRALQTGASWVLVLNNDTVVDPMILKQFVHAGVLIPDAAVLGAKIYFYSDRKRIWHAGATGIDELGQFRPLGNGCLDTSGEFSNITEVDYVYGCAFFVRTDRLQKIGLFDEKFFLTHEDLDWCFRAKRLGLKCIFVPDAQIWHKVSASFGGEQSPVHNYFMMRSRLLWAKKNLHVAQRCRLWRKVAHELFQESTSAVRWSISSEYPYLKQFYWLIRRLMRELRESYHRPEFRAKVYGVRDFLLGRFGYEDKTIRSLKA